MAINFAATLDNKNILAAVNEAKAAIGKLDQAVQGVGETVDDATGSIKEMIKQAAALGGISLGMAGVKEFLSQMISVRKEMQGFQISLDTLLGDKDRASAMFSELKDFAASTPLALNTLASGAQTMLGFNIEAERVIPTLRAIGDISMGDSQKFQSLTLAFSQMSATGKLMGQDLLQMINAGFNPLTEISRKTGKSIGELKEAMEKGAISVEMVTEAFMSATSEGGKFYKMLEKQSEGLAGKINTLNGAIDDMYNSLAEQSAGAINTAISGVTVLVQNYDKVGKAIAAIVATYGTYKAAIVATVAVERLQILGLKDTIKYTWLQITATKAATVAQNLFNKAVKANPYVIAATALVAVAGAMWAFAKNADAAKESQKSVNEELIEFTEQQNALDEELKRLIGIIQDENATNKERIAAYEQLKLKCHQLTDEYSLERLAVLDLKSAYEALEGTRQSRKAEHLEDQKNEVQKVLEAVQKAGGAWSNLDKDSEAYLRANGFVGKSLKQVEEQLKEDLKTWEEKIAAHQKEMSDKASQEVETTFQNDAKSAYEAWKKAKKEYESIMKDETATAKQVLEARAAMEKADKEYERLTGEKASKKSNDASKNAQNRKNEAAKRRELEESIAKEEQREAKDRELNTTQARIDAMKEGTGKVLAQIDLDYQKQMEEIKREEEDLKELREKNARDLWEVQNPELVKKNANAWVDSGEQKKWRSNYKLKQEDQDYFDDKKKAASFNFEERVKEENEKAADAMRQFLKEYGNYFEQRNAIIEEYNAKIENATTDGEKLLHTAEMNKALEDIDSKFSMSSSKIKKLWGDVSKASRKTLTQMIADLKKVQSAIKDGVLTTEEQDMLKQLGFTEEDIQKVANADTTIEAIIARIKDLQGQLDSTTNAFKKFGDAFKKNADGKIDFEKIGEGFNAMMSSVKGYADGLNALSDILSNGKIAAAMEDVNTFVNEVGTGASVGASAGGGWGALIGAIIGVASGIAKVVNTHVDDDSIKRIDNLNKEIKRLQHSYNDLSDAVDKAYSKNKEDLVENQIANLEKQNKLIRQQIAAENKKKDPDKSVIESYRDEIYSNEQEIKKLREEAADAIFGQDIQSAIENFADAYADAWANNTNRTKTAKEQVREMMQSMVKESIKAATEASSAMETIREKLKRFFEDGVLTTEEQNAIYAEAEALQKELDARFGWADDLLDKNNDFTQQGTSGGFTAMSQESADELNGRFAAGQMTIESILSQTMLIYATNQQTLTVSTDTNETLKEIRNLMIQMSGNVEDIAIYTKALTTFGEKFDAMNRQLAKL